MPEYRITADFVCHDVKFATSVRVTARLDKPPTPGEAEQLFWPDADTCATCMACSRNLRISVSPKSSGERP